MPVRRWTPHQRGAGNRLLVGLPANPAQASMKLKELMPVAAPLTAITTLSYYMIEAAPIETELMLHAILRLPKRVRCWTSDVKQHPQQLFAFPR